MANNPQIRHAAAGDLPALTGIYNHYITNTAVTFDVEPYTTETRLPWFNQFAPGSRHQLWVLLEGDVVSGYASSSPLRPKRAYDTSVETSIYLKPDRVGNGLGKALYASLFAGLTEQDVHRCYGIIALPNDASIALHQHFGFIVVGHLNQVGRKFDRYWDTQWMEKALRDDERQAQEYQHAED